MLGVLALSHVDWLYATALAGSVFFMIIFFATANTAVQTRVPDELRGRVMGIYSLAFIGMAPFGSLIAGSLAHVTSASFTVTLGSVICLIAGLIVMRIMKPQQTGH